ncbi:16S rRNA (guanine966-N2)-methyltransferase [Ornithinibacillus halophilus]|uniref:16S rRNA (Guanine966-N2)-methyltransferase n=1 Tax=Ornithinibacillus halophilus TaxID=930117 RepID=A0A1M5C2X2_9BACI|nr:16S rRNA (guanine966-N2)-methyltransferase [Ornithinibacillus halophilus]
MKAVPGKNTRPTTDKVKESIFQMLGPFFEGGKCLDLFAGSGSLGFEAISRGMDTCLFIDKHPQAIQTIKENIKLLKLENNTEVYRADAFRALHAASKRGLRFDLIFLDPPYNKISYEKLLDTIEKLNLLADGGLVYCEYDPSDKLPEKHLYSTIKQANYGGTIGITIFQKTGGNVND